MKTAEFLSTTNSSIIVKKKLRIFFLKGVGALTMSQRDYLKGSDFFG